LVPLWIRLNMRVGESEFVRLALALALARIVLHYIRVKVLLFYTAVKLFEHILCSCSNSSAGSVDARARWSIKK
jgi:hypothetical protein